jgi:hypothetical protein
MDPVESVPEDLTDVSLGPAGEKKADRKGSLVNDVTECT